MKKYEEGSTKSNVFCCYKLVLIIIFTYLYQSRIYNRTNLISLCFINCSTLVNFSRVKQGIREGFIIFTSEKVWINPERGGTVFNKIY